MNKDDEYIKMVLALPDDFFKDWKWQAGDMAIILSDPYKREVLIIDSPLVQIRRGNNWLKAIFPYAAYDEYDMFDKDNLRPIPTQRQIQDILLANHPHKTFDFMTDLHALFFNFRYWVQNDDEDTWNDFRDEFKNLDQAWLAFAIRELYNKKWNGEAWV